MNCVRIELLEQREPGVAERIHAVQMAAYAQEAALRECENSVITVSTGVQNIPALALYADLGFVECGHRTLGPEALELLTLRRAPTLQDS